ncbi:ThiF family adenylyltransferase [Spirosoma endophyticum]|uniref:Integrative and conjugative element protein, VC0181 family n=1 Tax=Spirosoma endophyticum TaxID=662367 RepID=A0A1I2FF83_9BACT|nr:ThiF family adenylyltransferase [Spirosoma endophyticum]SFF03131.1 integrative and conjugative element protein, VC0181 family [Spirosoma endophyticum]
MKQRWYKRHPDYYRQESQLLRTDSTYQEYHQVTDELFISCGEIIIRQNELHRYPILLVYPESAPYSLPSIYPLKTVPDKDTLDVLAKHSDSEIPRLLGDNRRFFDRRHQMSGGALCILESDHLETGSSFYQADQVLMRVRDWLAGLTSGRFPTDSSEVELFSHFRNRVIDTELIYPIEFLDESLMQGDFYAYPLAVIPKGKQYIIEKRIYYGVFISGQTSNGLFQLRPIDRWQCYLPEGFVSMLDLETKPGLLKEAVDKKELLKGYWFSIQTEPAPFIGLDGLLDLIGNNDRQTGLMRMYQVIGKFINELNPFIFIGIRYPNRRGELEWQLFRLDKTAQTPQVLLGVGIDEFTHSLLNSYETVSAIQTELLSNESYHQRNAGRADYSLLAQRHAVMIGCGSLGSEIADILNKAGMGSIMLVDKELFKAHNAVRHLINLYRIGIAKVHALAEELEAHNPFVNIQYYPGDVLNGRINEYFDTRAVGISTIADDNVEGFLNEQCIRTRRPMYYSRALRGGKAARIFRVRPGQDACFHCLSLYAAENNPILPRIEADLALPVLTNECNNPVRPASSADLKLIASITSRLLLDDLQGRLDDQINHWIWTTEENVPSDGTTPFSLLPSTIPPHPHCSYCQFPPTLTVQCPLELLDTMRMETQKEPKLETGGVLAGRFSGKTLSIEAVSGPGPNAIRTPTYFERDVTYCQQFVDAQYQQSGYIYLGEWHYHPMKDNRPSATDLGSLEDIAISNNYLTELPIMIIFNNQGEPSCTVHPAAHPYYPVTISVNSASTIPISSSPA